MLFARVTDALFDPILGAYIERHPTRWGRFRPWLLFASPAMGAMTVLTFMTVPGGQHFKLIWAALTYLFQGLLYSAVNLPYGALGAVMSRDSRERVDLGSARTVGMNVGVVLINAITMPLAIAFSGEGDSTNIRGYTLTALTMVLIAVPMLWLVFARCHEAIVPDTARTRVPLTTTFRVVVTNGPLMLVASTMLLMLTGIFGRLAVALYYYIYLMNRQDLVALLMSLPSIATVVGIALFTRLSSKLGKRRLLIVSLIMTALPLLCLFFVEPSNTPAVIVLNGLYGLFFVATPLALSMIPDAIDYQEDRTGIRSDGSGFALSSVSIKLGSAVGGAIGTWILAGFGYVANSVQTEHATLGINVAVNLVPAAFLILAAIPMFFYPVTEDLYEEVRSRLETGKSSQVPAS
ncbi:hypothetical protein BW737_015180 [Actinomyces ruminis]|uniref:Major facilitator superfamily (MFS) profile domain-containing protein n=1 Tax=Actinomyces ruminis TaxID=1937003 RepID=A0ABX4M8S0_9ACTO|nr:glycoside-pentoside-hexuronide (GPH):cation symporter [Actinomyces ruminis]PHP51331.1 hypothetical protein BW737_015180 [Actinomyces ruminis]